MLQIDRYISDMMFSNMYVLTDRGHSIVIDPYQSYTLQPDMAIDLVIVTHEHYDHISGVNRLKDEYNVPLMCSNKCASRINNSRDNMARYFEAFCEIQGYGEYELPEAINNSYKCEADITFNGELSFIWQGNGINIFELPGHSPGSIGIVINNQYFFSGDSLLPGCVTNCRFPGGDIDIWNDLSVPRIKSLPACLTVYPGHKECFYMDMEKDSYDFI